MMTIFLISLVLILGSYLIFLLLELRQLTKQLAFIAEKETNAELTSTSKSKLIRNLLNENNHLIRKNKQFYRDQVAKDKALHELLTNLTHDLKTPLTVASGYTQLLERAASPENSEIIGKIGNSLEAIKQYLSYLMAYNLIQEKNIALNLEQANISELLRESLFLYHEEFIERQIIPDFQLLDEDCYAIVDVTVLQRIFQNILGNVVNHGKGFITVTMAIEQQSLKLNFSNGLDAPIDRPETLMQRFKTNERSRTHKNTGLGLNIIQELCQLIQAQMTLQVTDSVFTVLLTIKLR